MILTRSQIHSYWQNFFLCMNHYVLCTPVYITYHFNTKLLFACLFSDWATTTGKLLGHDVTATRHRIRSRIKVLQLLVMVVVPHDHYQVIGKRRNPLRPNSRAMIQDLDQRSKVKIVPKLAQERPSCKTIQESSQILQALQEELPLHFVLHRQDNEGSNEAGSYSQPFDYYPRALPTKLRHCILTNGHRAEFNIKMSKGEPQQAADHIINNCTKYKTKSKG